MLQLSLPNTQDILRLYSVESTNIAAHEAIAQDGIAAPHIILATFQTGGMGQRGASWWHSAFEAIAMSYIVGHHGSSVGSQFILNMAAALAVRECVHTFLPSHQVCVKWSNDVYVANKKIAGLLLENIIRGSTYTHTIVGIGLNVSQQTIPDWLPQATSMALEGSAINVDAVEEALLLQLQYFFELAQKNEDAILLLYNKHLYKRGERCNFLLKNGGKMEGNIEYVNAHGLLSISPFGNFAFGEIKHVIE